MALPNYDYVVFTNAPVSLALGQVKFPILPRFGEAGFIAEFQEAIRSEYPRISRERQIALQLSMEEVKQDIGGMLWRFADRSNLLSVVVGENAITIEAQGYSSIEDFLSRFQRILSVASQTMGVSERTRLGLRYINELRHPDAKRFADWRRLLNPQFVDFKVSDLLVGDVERTLAEMQVRCIDGTLTIRHGLLTGTAIRPVTQSPQTDEPFYLIDLDYYDTTEQELDIHATIAQMRKYNGDLYRFFRWTLSDELFGYMEPKNAT